MASFQRYNIEKRLGKGAYGIVWRATEKSTGRTVALKKIFDAFRNVTDAQRTFREIIYLQGFSVRRRSTRGLCKLHGRGGRGCVHFYTDVRSILMGVYGGFQRVSKARPNIISLLDVVTDTAPYTAPYYDVTQAVAMSEDHKPNLPAEKQRIHRSGGKVIDANGTYRVGQ